MDQSMIVTQRLDKLPFSRWHLVLILAIGTIWIFDGYEVSLVSLFSSYILNDHSETQFKTLATSYQLGCILGSISFGLLAFYRGRRTIFMVTLMIYAVGVIFCLLGQNFQLFILGRILTGLAVGGQFTAIFTAIDEFLPPKVRGRVDIVIDGSWHLGGVLGALLNFVLGEFKYWRMLFGVGLIGIVVLGIIRRNVPESPRWLIMKGRVVQAQNIVSGIENCVLSNKSFLSYDGNYQQISDNTNPMSAQLQEESIQQNDRVSPSSSSSSVSQQSDNQILCSEFINIFSSYKKRLFLSCFLIFSQAFFFNLIYYQFPIILKDKYHFDQRQISSYMIALSFCSFFSTVAVGPLFDNVGRNTMLLVTYLGAGIMIILTQSLNVSPFQLLVMTCIMFIFGSPASSSANLIASEIFPTATRPIVLSLIFILGMFGGMVGVWVNNHYVSGILMSLAGVIGWALCPAAEGKSLQQVNKMNSGDHVVEAKND